SRVGSRRGNLPSYFINDELAMLENTLRFLTAVVKPKPTFTIPPSDPDPVHNFSMRDRNSSKNLSSYPSGNSITSWSSSQRQ
ncbi:unnamed protein product, partial [Mycena citricolor]